MPQYDKMLSLAAWCSFSTDVKAASVFLDVFPFDVLGVQFLLVLCS